MDLPASLVLVIASCMAVWLPGIAAYLALRDRGTPRIACLASIALIVGMGGWLVFVGWFIWPALGLSLGIAIEMAAAVFAWRFWSRDRAGELRIVLYAILIGCCYTSIMLDKEISSDLPRQAALRYWAAPDNIIPKIFADAMISGDLKNNADLKSMDSFGWQLSDRPPLMTGIILPAYRLMSFRPDVAYQFLGMAANLLWVFSFWAFLLSIGVSERNTSIVFVVTAFVGAIFISGVYVWPKLLAAALAFSAAALARDTKSQSGLVSSGAAAALAILSHGAIAFGLIGLFPAVYARLKRSPFRHIAAGVLCAVLLYAPWAAYQKYYDPPGDRLLKWHLAGQVEIDNRPLWQLLRERFERDGFGGTLRAKIDNVRVLRGVIQFDEGNAVRNLRASTLQFVGLSPAVLLIGIAVSLLGGRIRRDPSIRMIWAVVIATSVAFCLIESGAELGAVTWLITAPYSLVVLWSALGALSLALHGSRAAMVVLGASVAFFYFVWVNTLGFQASLQNATDRPLSIDARMLTFVCGALLLTLLMREKPIAHKP
jgi:hypothetical protein